MSARIKAIVFLILGFFFIFASPASAAEITITSYPSSVLKLEEFDVGFTAQQLDSNAEYYLKARIGKESQTPNKGETYNPSTENWLHDSSAWVDFPKAIADANGALAATIRARAKDTVEIGINRLTVRVRKTDSTSNIDSSPVEIEIRESPSPSPTPTPSPSPTPTPTITPIPSPSTATYKINEAKDENGDVLSSVKVYLDGVYLHHYAPETLTFCDGCQCDTYVNCGFGEHTIKLEKSGYDDWHETKTINAGDSYEVNPVLSPSGSTPSSTPTPTPSPTPSPSLTGVELETTLGGEILGEEGSPGGIYLLESPTPSPEVLGEKTSKSQILPKIFLIVGSVFLFVAAFSLWYNLLKDYRGKSSVQESKIID